ncbi:hypothetical protein Btru_001687 [Bulinus truncatus]|nr:hypothetical protein Btru_001687 [Bulinus truncatus]
MACHRSLLRLLKFALPVLIILILLNGAFFFNFLQNKLRSFRAKSLIVPYNQLERGYASRQEVLSRVQKYIYIHWAQKAKGQALNKFCSAPNTNEICLNVQNEIDTLRAMGIYVPDSNVSSVTNRSSAGDPAPTRKAPKQSLVNPGYVKTTLCYNESRSRYLDKRTVDPTFCARLLQLLQDIRSHTQPFLLVLFSWWPDSLFDPNRYNRKLLPENCKRLRPFVEFVIFTDSRMTMSNANAMDYPCLPVPGYNPDGVPVFRKMAEVVMETYNATFYGYVRATTVFDASFVETLLAIKEAIVKSPKVDKAKATKIIAPKPVFVYGEAMHYSKITSAADLKELNNLAHTRGSYEWEVPQSAFMYFTFTKHDVSDIPPLIIDDDDLTPFMISRSRVLGHAVIDAGRTVTSLYLSRNSSIYDWNRRFLKLNPRDPLYNKKLAVKQFGSKSLPEVTHDFFSTYNSEGKVVFKGGV